MLLVAAVLGVVGAMHHLCQLTVPIPVVPVQTHEPRWPATEDVGSECQSSFSRRRLDCARLTLVLVELT